MPSVHLARTTFVRAAAWTVVVLCGAFVTTLVVRDVATTERPAEVRSELENSAVLVIDHDGFRYTYHVITGAEALFDVSSDPEQLVSLHIDRPNMCRRFRVMLRTREKVADLSDLQEPYRHEIEGLRTLGYL